VTGGAELAVINPLPPMAFSFGSVLLFPEDSPRAKIRVKKCPEA